MVNPFMDDALSFFALVNSEGQYSLWPKRFPLPPGWTVAFGPDARTACLAYIERSWVDMRPRSAH